MSREHPRTEDGREAAAPDRVDVLRYGAGTDDERRRAVGAGWGDHVVAAHVAEARRRRRVVYAVAVAIVAVGVVTGVLLDDLARWGGGAALAAVLAAVATRRRSPPLPEVIDADLPTGRARETYELASVIDDPRTGSGAEEAGDATRPDRSEPLRPAVGEALDDVPLDEREEDHDG